ncbi:complement C1r subcomponent-like isoform X2 [Mixophyes fleayi]|uniref:complement C1r subcomponent-like isoform X2 n=1 Tax=Mixophyes fleayi TaxID=3061075 RepID=UPI003F4E4445
MMDLRWLFLTLLGCACAGSTSLFGKITFPNYLQGYPSNANKTWDIQVPEGYGIRMYFIHLDIEPSENCENDFVKVIIGNKVQQTLCGRRLIGYKGIPKEDKYYPFTHLKLLFKSDSSNQERYTGFSAYYMAVDVDECEEDSHYPCSHFCHNYNGGYSCSCPPEYDIQQDQQTCGPLSCGSPLSLRNGQYIFLTEPNNVMYLSSIVYKCNESFYEMVTQTGSAKFTCSEGRVWKDENGGQQIPKCVPVCGKQHNPLARRSRILNGDKAAPGNFPWQVAVRKFEQGMQGGGLLIGERWVMTAGHMFGLKKSTVENKDDVTNLKIYVGDTDMNKLIEKGNLQVKGVHVHPNYTSHNYDNDIALIELQDPLVMDENVSPICLPEDNEEDLYQSDLMGYVSGFGVTEDKKLSNKLRYVSLPVVQRNKCQQQLKKRMSDKYDFTENMFCAGFPESTELQKDSCSGDAGCPFAILKNGRWVVTGLVSWGFECGRNYGYYTKVSNYIDWIKGYIDG